MKSKIVYWLTYAGMWLVALLPFRALYALSDGLYFLMRHVVHYRKKVVRRNLRNSFPEKSETELMEIERKFYHYICDYMLEEVKMLRMCSSGLPPAGAKIRTSSASPDNRILPATYAFSYAALPY